MTPRTRTRTRTALLAAALAVAGTAVAATAFGAVTVYDNDFSSRAEVNEVKKAGGKACGRKFVHKGKRKSMRATVKTGPRTCSFRPPVQGDGELPNFELKLDAKVAKSTKDSARRGAFLGVSVRVGGGGVGYHLQVFPHNDRFKLTRGPNSNAFPVNGTEGAIAPIGKKNTLRLSVQGARVRATVNGTEVADVTDNDPGAVSGSKLRFAVGNERSSGKDVVGTVKNVKVTVPDP
jgi:Domain of Unknown Function (DUF1080)